jgi:hypothetical protein
VNFVDLSRILEAITSSPEQRAAKKLLLLVKRASRDERSNMTDEISTIERRREYCRAYHLRNDAKIKARRRAKFAEYLRRKLEKIKLTNPNPPSRKCPSCGIDLYYVNKRNLLKAEEGKSVCNSCKFYGTQNPSYRKAPHNKGVFTLTEPERKRKAWVRHLKRDFGISEKEYDALLESQGGRCKICKTPRTELNRPLYIDHCHNSNKIRGLLCHKCNTGLGLFNENVDILSSAMEYLKSCV